MNESIESQKVDQGDQNPMSQMPDPALHKSVVENEGNSSIDMPSFHTEHDPTFLWNKAKIVTEKKTGSKPGSIFDGSGYF